MSRGKIRMLMWFDRVVMHGIRVELLRQQAENAGLPLHIIEIPYPCSNGEYAFTMSGFIDLARRENVECFAFGDLLLEDIRQYRKDHLNGTGITSIFPLWCIPTRTLSQEMIAGG